MIKFRSCLFFFSRKVILCPSQYIISRSTKYPFVLLLMMLTLITWLRRGLLSFTTKLLFRLVISICSEILCKYLVYNHTIPTNWWFFPEMVITVLFLKWWFPISIILSTSIIEVLWQGRTFPSHLFVSVYFYSMDYNPLLSLFQLSPVWPVRAP